MRLPLRLHHLLCAGLASFIFGTSPASAQFLHFVQREGDRLMDGTEELRFVSYNIPNLHYVEDDHRFEQPSPFRLPTRGEITDALTAIRQAGGKVVRMYTLSLRKPTDDPSILRHVYAPGVFDEAAFRTIDTVFAEANRIGVRIIFPLVDNWWWWGGPTEYAAFRGKDRGEFWTDSLLQADYRMTVAHMVGRVNTVTGTAYADDKALLGWETGNELECPYAWTHAMAAYIKSLDPHHLVIEGTFAKTISEEALADSVIDVVSTHHYMPAARMIPLIVENRERARGRKPYIVGEFGAMPLPDMRRMLDTVVATGISGIMIWAMRGHNADGGFYYHGRSYRWPGFPSGALFEEQGVIRLLREEAGRINGWPPDSLPIPDAPRMLSAPNPSALSWQGSTGAESYILERRTSDDSPWIVVDSSASDAEVGYHPLSNDTSALSATGYFYRVRARNSAGISGPSNSIGPLYADGRVMIDELDERHVMFAASEGVHPANPREAARAKEDPTRYEGSDGDYLEYHLPAEIRSVNVDAYLTSDDTTQQVTFEAGATPDRMAPVPSRMTVYPVFSNEYRAFLPVRFRAEGIPPGATALRIVFARDIQVGRVEVRMQER